MITNAVFHTYKRKRIDLRGIDLKRKVEILEVRADRMDELEATVWQVKEQLGTS
jgi:hypothetical protein